MPPEWRLETDRFVGATVDAPEEKASDVGGMLTGVVIAIVCLPAFLPAVWFVEVLAGCVALLRNKSTSAAPVGTPPFRTAVLIPAHNEGTGTISTIQDAQAELGAGDRIVVVADNCTDDTAAIA